MWLQVSGLSSCQHFFHLKWTSRKVTSDTLKYSALPSSRRGWTVISNIGTILTAANFVFDLSSSKVTNSILIDINFFYVYFPECARCTRNKIFFQQYTQLCFELKVERQIVAFSFLCLGRGEEPQFCDIQLSRLRRVPSSHTHN